jgi:hypothetical protein
MLFNLIPCEIQKTANTTKPPTSRKDTTVETSESSDLDDRSSIAESTFSSTGVPSEGATKCNILTIRSNADVVVAH